MTVGRGVTIHRADCANLARLALRSRERLLQVQWGEPARPSFSRGRPACDGPAGSRPRRHDAARGIEINLERLASRPNARHGSVDLSLRIAITNLDELARLLPRLAALPGVIRRRALSGLSG